MQYDWTLIDVEQARYVEEWDYDGKAHGWPDLTISMRRLRGGMADGVEQIVVTDGDFSWTVLPSRGMSVHHAQLDDWRIGWQSPVKGPIHPAYVPLNEPSGLGWLSGFDELFVRCGLESNGAPDFDEKNRLTHPLHGRIGNLPARKVSVAIDPHEGTVSLTGVILETRFHFYKLELSATITARKGKAGLVFNDVIRNLSASPSEAQMLYHINFGSPLLDAGAQFIAPVKQVVPRNAHAATGLDNWDRYSAPMPGIEEQVYFLELISGADGKTVSMLKDAHATRAAVIRHATETLPCYSLWKNPTSLEDGYVTGLEPGTNFPNPRSFEGEKGRVIKLAAGGQATLQVTLDFLQTTEAIEKVEREVAQLQSGTNVQIHAEPVPDWCS